MRCTKHKKEIMGNCTWCGRHVCALCIAKKEGKRLYCEKCAIQLAGFKRVKIPKVEKKPLQETTLQKQIESSKRRIVLDDDGYLVIEQ
jgi:hypothetical protein